MSANRSVQAAQRRRAGPSNSEPGIPGRSPQPSINSAQMFASQARPGQGPNIPNGRLAGQHAAMQQQQMQQQSLKNQQNQQSDKLSSVSKMTIPQAITLITLRLGAVETKLLNKNDIGSNISIDGDDDGFLQNIMARLETLENRSTTSIGSTPEISLLKQQFETIKQSVVQSKNTIVSLVKENSIVKAQVDNINKELIDIKSLIQSLNTVVMENSQKILDLDLYMGETTEYHNDLDESNILSTEDIEDNEIIGTDLKQLIKSELNIEC
jgi:hypothetical protein